MCRISILMVSPRRLDIDRLLTMGYNKNIFIVEEVTSASSESNLDKIIVTGGRKLSGEVRISGAKNSVLPLIAATLLTDGVSLISESPWLSDVDIMCRVMEHLGVKTGFDHGELS